MNPIIKIGYELTQGRKIERPKKSENYVYWKSFIKDGLNYKSDKKFDGNKKDFPAAILQSGGSTGIPKGIVLSNGNFNASTIQAKIALPDLDSNDVVLGIMPIFHGFGLQVLSLIHI